MKSKSILIACLLGVWVAMGCSLSTVFPIAGPTQSPTSTVSKECSADGVLVTLRNSQLIKKLIPEYAVDYSLTSGTRYLNFWFVDPNIDPHAVGQELDTNNQRAIADASGVAIYAVAADACIRSVFDSLNPVVVDRNYNGWFSGAIPVASIPATSKPSDQDIYNAAAAFRVVYSRRSPPAAVGIPPIGSCTWQQANQRMHLHFDASRQNVDFYFVGDEVSRKVTAQWDGAASTATDLALIYASIMNVTQEIRCLYPPPDYLYIMVLDANGSLVSMGRLPSSGIKSMDLNQLDLMFVPSQPAP